MSSSTPTAITRYRPAILVLTGAAAAYGAYLLYGSLQAVPNDALHRSNAIRRANPSRRPSRTTRIISRLESEVSALGEYNVLGLVVPLDPLNLIAPDELRELLGTTAPDASEATIEVETARLYDVFLDRLLDSGFSNRPLAPAEIDAVARWVGARLPGPATIPRAVERRTQRLNDARPADPDGAESVAGTDVSWNSDEDSDVEGIDPEGQTLQRTLYHIAEDRARQEGVIHRGITCNSCDEKPIRGTRWHCANCVDFDLCSTCEATNSHTKTHIFYKMRVPAPYLSLTKQEPIYPGKPHMMHHSVNSVLKRRLASETKMEVEEIEALWDQFTCLASTEWTGDPNKVGWALDRRAFNHAFVPRYNGFVAAPNLIYDRIFQYYDSDKNGLIGFEEWIKGIDGMHTTDTKVKARIVFNGYDIDGDGYISRRDVLRVFRAYYAIEKEATRNFVAELTEELSVRNSMDTIRSSQPLGSAFPPNSLATSSNTPHASFAQKQNGSFDETSPVILDTDFEHATRKTVIEANEIHQLLEVSSRQSAGDSLVQEAWARREFTLDEEEGLARPVGADLTDEGVDLLRVDADPMASGPKAEQSESRRSSKVHFQDEVNHREWQSKSISKKPTSEQWGGYEIPELEQDLGKEVLYQITQQAFNELLDPLFRAREDMALAAQSLRSERRKNAEAIGTLLQTTKGWGGYNAQIFRGGIFRFAKIVTELYCLHMSMDDFKILEQQIQEGNWKEINSRVSTAIAAAEELATVHLKPDDGPQDAIAEWNAEFVKQKLHEELLSVTVRILNPSGHTDLRTDDGSTVQDSAHPAPICDPTMPQFRPNTAADLGTNRGTEVVEDSHRSSTASELEQDLEDFADEDGQIRVGPGGPYFVRARHPPEDRPTPEEEQAQLLTTPTASPPPGVDFHDSESSPVTQNPSLPGDTLTTPRPSREFSQTQEETGRTPSQPSQESGLKAPKPPHFTNTPWLQTLYIDTSSNGKRSMWYTSRHVAHTQNLYAIAPEPDQTAALIANLRRSAISPESPLYLRLLASCEAVEQESRKRSGDGLLSFDEFEEVLRDGRLRFLESWMDWIMDGLVRYHVYFRMP